MIEGLGAALEDVRVERPADADRDGKLSGRMPDGHAGDRIVVAEVDGDVRRLRAVREAGCLCVRPGLLVGDEVLSAARGWPSHTGSSDDRHAVKLAEVDDRPEDRPESSRVSGPDWIPGYPDLIRTRYSLKTTPKAFNFASCSALMWVGGWGLGGSGPPEHSAQKVACT